METAYKTHNFKTLNLEKMVQDIKSDGVVVIENVYTKPQCDKFMDQTMSAIENLNTGIDRNSIKKTWKKNNLPNMSKYGLFQGILGHIEPVWEVRKNQEIKKIFEAIYRDVRGRNDQENDQEKEIPLTVSIDGINFQPNNVGPVANKNDIDWAHVDQTTYNDPFKCIQGSVALSNTTAGFMCSPKSHLVLNEILKINEISENPPDLSNWKRYPRDKIEEIRNLVEGENSNVGGKYQIPIIVPAGSLILWFSSTTHSARVKTKNEKKSKDDAWLGWRGVYYISYRPTEEFSEEELDLIEENTRNNYSMNHWSTATFSPFPSTKFEVGLEKNFHENIQELMGEPKLLFEKSGFRPEHPNFELRKEK